MNGGCRKNHRRVSLEEPSRRGHRCIRKEGLAAFSESVDSLCPAFIMPNPGAASRPSRPTWPLRRMPASPFGVVPGYDPVHFVILSKKLMSGSVRFHSASPVILSETPSPHPPIFLGRRPSPLRNARLRALRLQERSENPPDAPETQPHSWRFGY